MSSATLTTIEIEILTEHGTACAQMAWDSLVEESDVPVEWNTDGDEPWHSLDRAWKCKQCDDECTCGALTDDDRDEAFRIVAKAASAKWNELRAAWCNQAEAIAQRVRDDASENDSDEDVIERVAGALRDSLLPGSSRAYGSWSRPSDALLELVFRDSWRASRVLEERWA